MTWYRKFPLWATCALLVYMPFHLFLSQWVSSATGGIEIWKAAKDVVLAVVVLECLLVVVATGVWRRREYRVILLLALAYAFLHLLFILFDKQLDLRSALIASTYNTRLFWYLFVGVTAVLEWPGKQFPWRKILLVVLTVSTLVSLFAVLQYFLPKDLMTHFGYSLARGARPAFFIDDKPDLPRVMSTIRDPNSLGAYLILPIVLLVSLWRKKFKNLNRKTLLLGLLGLHGLALLLTFSRGAWLGALLALAVMVYIEQGKAIRKNLKQRHLLTAAALAVILLAGLFVLRNTYAVQNVVVHADKSTVQANPNELRVQFGRQAIDGIIDKPLGHGPGTAGLVAINNPKGGLLTENYFLQIGYEVGIFGLLLFLGFLAYAYRQLLGSPNSVPVTASHFRTALLASFWAYILMSLLIHLWSNEAVAAQWWLLAGLTIGQTVVLRNKRR